MHPSMDEIAKAAYHRWQRRECAHGRHDEDWIAAERDLTFGLNYRWAVRHGLRPTTSESALVWLGESSGTTRRCRFCERSAPATSFDGRHAAFPAYLGNTRLMAWEECDDCRAQYDEHLDGPFESFASPLLGLDPDLDALGTVVPVAALKALVRMGLTILPEEEFDQFDDAVEWVSNPDDDRDTALMDGLGLGCHVYVTPEPVPSPFASLARRLDDDARFPYMAFFLGTGRVVFQTHLPFCPRDEELDEADRTGPVLSLSMGRGGDFRSSQVRFLPMASPEFSVPRAFFQTVGAWHS
ncbi:MAG: DUF2934 domain-containing protein [Isosphaeraceae bacterium]